MISPRGLSTWSNRTLRQHSLDVFDRTFRITDALTVLAELIAALGVLNALLALHLERAREYAVLRACGCDAALMRRSLYATSLFVAFAAVLFAIPVGAGIAWLLTAIINVRSFGWSMSLSWTLAAVLVPAAVAVVAALLASIYPTERALRQMPAVVLRNE
jgi:putative ABC transport system permease protein